MKFDKNIYLIFCLFAIISCNQVRLSDARDLYVKGDYHAASLIYRKLYRENVASETTLRGVIAFEMGEVYRNLNRSSLAATAYRNAIRFDYPDSLKFLRYAQMLHKEGDYNKAIDSYNRFLEINPDNILAINGIKGAALSLVWQEESLNVCNVKYAELFNSTRGEFSPMFANGDKTLYFTSSRKEALGDADSPITGIKYNDIFISEKNALGQWQNPQRVSSEINSQFDEGTPSVSSNGRFMFYTYSSSDPTQKTSPKIYVSRKINGKWSLGQELEIVKNDTLSLFAHPAISLSQEYLYFVSDMSGGYGGKDIWRAKIGSDFKPIQIENLGPQINTPGNEMFPYLRNDTTLYFSSDGHPGMGGLDVFVAKIQNDSKKWHIENLKPPINSSADDFAITFEKNEERGFFSSNRNDARGFDHIYSFEFPKTTISVEGFVVDHEDVFISGATVLVVGTDGLKRSFITNKNGEYKFEAKFDNNYLLMATAKGFLDQKKSLQIDSNVSDTLIYVDFEMIPHNKPVVLENVFYDFDSATLRKESKEELNLLLDLLNEYPKIKIELKAHTDRWGTDEYNFNLSQKRVQSVKDYLISKGFDKERIIAVAVGKSDPKEVTSSLAAKHDFLNEGDILTEELIQLLSVEQQQIADQINRRTEFKVIDF